MPKSLNKFCFAALACALSAFAFADHPKQIDVPAGDLLPALEAVAKQVDVELVFQPEQLKGLRTKGVNGVFSSQDAVKKLLEGTRLQLRTDETTGAMMIGAAAVSEASTRSTVGSREGQEAMRLAQAPSTGGSSPEESTKASQSSSGTKIEEIVVTAQRRKERLQDVPISISVLNGAELDRSSYQGMTDAFREVPGLAVTVEGQGGGTALTMRGVAAQSARGNGSSPVAFYIDGLAFGFAKSAFFPDPAVYDLDRVEVLRGPQGTLYGANALNGVVRILTNDADPSQFEFKARGGISSTEGGGANYRTDMAVNVPLIEDKLAARAVVGVKEQSGWIDTLYSRDANEAQAKNMRLKINAKPVENLSIGLSAWFSREDYDAPSNSDENDFRGGRIAEPMETDYDAYGLDIGYDFSSFSVRSTTSYIDFSSIGILDAGSLRGPPIALNVRSLDNAETFSQEVNFNSTAGKNWRWSAGAMYRDAEDVGESAILPSTILGRESVTSESYAGFGELTRLLMDGRFEITAGLRYFHDDTGGTNRLPVPAIQLPGKTFHATTPRLVLTAHPNEQMTLYASYAEGFRSGGPQFASTANDFPAYIPDSLKNYEIGTKGSVFGGRLGFDMAVYYSDWQDVQQTLLVPLPSNPLLVTSVLVNGKAASGIGAEAVLTARPVDGLTLGLNLSWNDLTLDAPLLSGGVLLFEAGERLNRSPEYIAGASVDYQFPLGSNGFQGRFSTSVNYTSERDDRTVAANAVTGSRDRFIGRGQSMVLSRASFAVEAPRNWTASVYVDNLTNENNRALRPAFALRFLAANGWDERVRPRTVGLQVEYKY